MWCCQPLFAHLPKHASITHQPSLGKTSLAQSFVNVLLLMARGVVPPPLEWITWPQTLQKTPVGSSSRRRACQVLQPIQEIDATLAKFGGRPLHSAEECPVLAPRRSGNRNTLQVLANKIHCHPVCFTIFRANGTRCLISAPLPESSIEPRLGLIIVFARL